MDIRKVTVLGANGTMGSNVAGIWASFGNAHVYMISRTKEKSEQAIEKAANSVRSDAIKKNMEAKDYSELEECIQQSDLVFESIAEDKSLKQELLQTISQYLSPDTLVCSGTSGLSINEMAENLPSQLRQNYLGMHFFNPPYQMTLCEIIGSKYISEEKIDEIQNYLQKVLLRTIVVAKDCPAFIGNRIGFHLINMAIQYAELYKEKGGIDYIDAIMGPFTGRNMAPIRTADFVGLDVHKAIVDNVYQNTHDYAKERFLLPKYVEELIREGKVGYKVKEGLYKIQQGEEGKREYLVYDIETKTYRKYKKYDMEFAETMVKNLSEGLYLTAMEKLAKDLSEEAGICKRFLVEYVLYSLYINKVVGHSIHDADAAMATGFSWIPPLALIESFGGEHSFKKIVYQVLTQEEIKEFNVEELVKDCPKSKYDYKRFFKAKR